MLDRDDHDDRRQHRARDIGENRKQQRRRRQHRHGVDDHRKPAAAAEGAVGEARTDIDAVGDAAEAGRNRVGDAEAHQQAIVAGAKLAGLAGQLGAQQRVDRRDDRQRQRTRQDHRRRLRQRRYHRQPGEIHQHGAHRGTRRQRTDHRAQQVAEAEKHDGMVGDRAAAEADQNRRHLGRDPARVPHRREGQRGDQQTQRPRLADRREHAGKGNVVIKAQHVAELHQEQQHRGHVLETRHHRMRREFYQRAQPQYSEQRLQQAAEQDDGEEHQQRGGDAGCCARHRGRVATAKTAAGRERMSW